MSKQQRPTNAKNPRPVKPKAAPVVAEPVQPAQPVVQPAVVAEPVVSQPVVSQPVVSQPVVSQPVVSQPVEAAAQPSKQPVKVLICADDINFNPARVRRFLDGLGINSSISDMINELKAKISAYRTAESLLATKQVTEQKSVVTDGKKKVEKSTRDATADELSAAAAKVKEMSGEITSLEMKKLALSREKKRFSNESPIATAIICEEFVKQLLSSGMDFALSQDKKILQKVHLFDTSVEKLSLYPLFASLPSFRSTYVDLARSAVSKQHADELASKLSAFEKDFRKQHNIKKPKKQPAATTEAATTEAATDAGTEATQVQPTEPATASAATESAQPADAHDEASHESAADFKCYVQKVCNLLKQDEKYSKVRISDDVRSLLSDLVIEFIHKLVNLIYLSTTGDKNLKTIKHGVVMRSVHSMLIDNSVSTKSVRFEEKMIPDPEAVKAEAAKRDEAKKAGKEYHVDVEKLPQVSGLVAVQVVTYPDCGYTALEHTVETKLKAMSDEAKEKLVKETA